jgi:hypothetical protein
MEFGNNGPDEAEVGDGRIIGEIAHCKLINSVIAEASAAATGVDTESQRVNLLNFARFARCVHFANLRLSCLEGQA